ncbi:mu-type opioid receptor-like [Convolutriloba macropyga]|uniref:mu-type opioid receptor-like n=1 Tax=Convolutriloba macropyga TaxID=536237 RepID=UPI003F5221C3
MGEFAAKSGVGSWEVVVVSGLALIIFKTLPTFPKPPGSGVRALLFCKLYCSDYPLWALLNSSVFNLLLVTLDRYLSVIKPFFHKNKFSQGWVLTAAVVLTWNLGIITSSYMILPWVVNGEICEIDFSLPSWFFLWGGYWSLFGMLVIPTLLMLVAYAHISRILSKMPENSKGKRLQKKVTLSCFAVLTVFFICWIPDQIFFFLFSLNLPSLNITLGSWTYHVVVNLGYLNNCLNPLLYGFFNPNYRRVFRQMLCRHSSSNETSVAAQSRSAIPEKNYRAD